MTSINFQHKFWWRIAMLLVGVSCLFWLTIEDNNLFGVFTFAILIVGLIASRFSFSQTWANWKLSYRQIIFGGLVGFLCPVVMFILMVLKSGLHLHVTPEYTSIQIAFIFRSTPIWVLGGAIAGLGWKVAKN